MDTPSDILSLQDVRFRWSGRASFSLNVDHFSIKQGESVLLLGESGSGKSTLLSLICGTVVPEAGRIELAGQDMAALSGSRRDRLRAEQIGVIFQQFNLLPFGSVLDNILLPLHFAPERRGRAGDARERAAELCRALNLPNDVLHARTRTLSVGQQQRVAVARALIGQPRLIVADEPTSALDAETQGAFLDLLFDQTQAHGLTLLMVSHDPRLAERFGRTLRIEDIARSGRHAA